MQKIPIVLSGRGKGRAQREEEQGTGCESKGNHQRLNEEGGQEFQEVVDLEGERLPKKAVEEGRKCRQWDSGEAEEEGKQSGESDRVEADD